MNSGKCCAAWSGFMDEKYIKSYGNQRRQETEQKKNQININIEGLSQTVNDAKCYRFITKKNNLKLKTQEGFKSAGWRSQISVGTLQAACGGGDRNWVWRPATSQLLWCGNQKGMARCCWMDPETPPVDLADTVNPFQPCSRNRTGGRTSPPSLQALIMQNEFCMFTQILKPNRYFP